MKRMYTAGATAGRLDQSVGPFPTSTSPDCSGQEAKLSECKSGACTNDGKVYVTCFMNDPVSEECNIDPSLTTAAPGTVSELPTTKSTSVAPPSRSTASADASGATNTDSSKFVTTLGVPDPSEQGQGGTNIITIIAASVMGGGGGGVLC